MLPINSITRRPVCKLVSPGDLDGSSFSVQSSLKATMSQSIRESVPALIRSSAHAVLEVLRSRFGFLGDSDLHYFPVLDRSICSRVEFKFPAGVVSNKLFAYYGDSLLNTRLAQCALETATTSGDFTALRTKCFSEAALSSYYDTVYASRDCIVTWERFLTGNKPGANQKAEFIEALIGASAYYEEYWLLNKIIDDVIQVGEPITQFPLDLITAPWDVSM